MNAIEIKGVSKTFGKFVALKDISFTIQPGVIFGFLGPNGAGKTTTLRGCMGLMKFDTGSSKMLGMDPWKDRVKLHEKVGYLPSGVGIYRNMSGYDLLNYISLLGSEENNRRSSLRDKALEAVELSHTDLNRHVSNYSKGMRQKLAFVQAVQHSPELLLMDEPSEGLDPLIQSAVYEFLRELSNEGTTIMFSSHTLSEVEELCDQILIIRKGEVVVEASLDDLRHKRPRIVKLSSPDIELLKSSHGLSFVSKDHLGRSIFETTLQPNEIISLLAKFTLDEVIIEEISLENIFQSYYQEGQGK